MDIQPVFEHKTEKQKKEENLKGAAYAFVLLILFSVSASVVYQYIQTQLMRDHDRQHITGLDSMGEKIHDIFSKVDVYLVHSSNLYTVKQVLKKQDPVMKREVEHFFSRLIEANATHNSPTFDQIRLLDLNGMEKVRVNLNQQGRADVCAPDQLQNKSNRYYFKESIDLPKNHIYMSPLDLNIENGEIEKPFKPIIRFGVPVFDNEGTRIGLLMFNYRAQQILHQLETVDFHGENQWLLLNENGYYLHSPDPKKEFGFMFPEKNTGLFSDYPDLWNKIKTTKNLKLAQADGIYYRKNIRPYGFDTSMMVSKYHEWILLSFVPQNQLNREKETLNRTFLFTNSALALILGILGWIIGKSRVKNKWYLNSLKESATLDRMTGLLNHQEAVKRLAYQINVSNRSKHPLCIAYMDLNDLKPVNDTLGHKSGDQMIIAAAESIKEAVRKTDLAARVGGDEFLVIFPDTASDNIQKAIRRIEVLYTQKSRTLFDRKLTLSWGISFWQGSSDTIEAFMHRADKAMYAMKDEYKRSKKESR